MDLRILGPLSIAHAGTPVRVSAAKEEALLIRLALAEGRPVSTDALVDDLWEGSPPDPADNALRIGGSGYAELRARASTLDPLDALAETLAAWMAAG